MNSTMRISLAALLGGVLWAGVRAQGAMDPAAAPAGRAARTLEDVDLSLGGLSEEHQESQKALSRQYSDKRKDLVEGDEWRSLSRVERRSRLRLLQDAFKTAEGRLKDQYKARREALVRERQALEDSLEVPDTLGVP